MLNLRIAVDLPSEVVVVEHDSLFLSSARKEADCFLQAVDEGGGHQAGRFDDVVMRGVHGLLGQNEEQPEQGASKVGFAVGRLDLVKSGHKFVMERHGEFELFEAGLNFPFDLLILNRDHLEHFLEVQEEVLEIAVFLDDLVYGEGHPDNPLAPHVVRHLVLLRHKVGNPHNISHFVVVVHSHLVLAYQKVYIDEALPVLQIVLERIFLNIHAGR